ncbi:ArsR/SmtB family transcription factor [Aureibacter tunicatorum]|uniref:DNA-binding transcriptional ArsR family regulator n=1 Tax=Aureibacter tunicatorum TaxID=866807 RepID=A0AAE3XNT0_9BACT|nr:winged helix-turn-helix domain-containing protein [Aureibacter tunicatorum]MDR6239280.1 DNA-binding transcriptional ArsR family regulator [Aureibacter tunicatorum]BDD04795.1 transcriptional regulator [Aureibacter tunicatorum]
MKNVAEEHVKLARYAKALSHPARVHIVKYLLEQPCCYSGDMSEELSMPKSTLSQHLKELKDSGIIQGHIETPKIRYCINDGNWSEVKSLFDGLLKIQTCC